MGKSDGEGRGRGGIYGNLIKDVRGGGFFVVGFGNKEIYAFEGKKSYFSLSRRSSIVCALKGFPQSRTFYDNQRNPRGPRNSSLSYHQKYF